MKLPWIFDLIWNSLGTVATSTRESYQSIVNEMAIFEKPIKISMYEKFSSIQGLFKGPPWLINVGAVKNVSLNARGW